MTDRWQKIIDAISVVNLDSINKDKIKAMLDYDRTVDLQVLDNLYILKVISLDEYKEKMSAYIERLKESVYWAEKQLKTANEKGKDYDPMIFYGFGRPYLGGAIEEKFNNKK